MIDDYKKRVIVEWEELNSKIQKLEDFIEDGPFSELEDGQNLLLEMQLGLMRLYADVLQKRICTWKVRGV